MNLDLTGEHVLITGGSRGIGHACARMFLQEGARVTITGRSQAHLQTAREGLLGEGPGELLPCLQGDLSDAAVAAALVQAAEAIAPVDVLVNCAGAAQMTPYDELTPEAWLRAMQAKFVPYVNVMDPLIKRMGLRGGGAVVNVIGIGGKWATPTHLPGGAANAALMLATAGLAHAWGPQGVRVNAVNPALTLTDRLAEGLASRARLHGISEQEAMRQSTAQVPLGRLASPEDIACAVVFLASPRAGYVSGAILSMDGAAIPTVV